MFLGRRCCSCCSASAPIFGQQQSQQQLHSHTKTEGGKNVKTHIVRCNQECKIVGHKNCERVTVIQCWWRIQRNAIQMHRQNITSNFNGSSCRFFYTAVVLFFLCFCLVFYYFRLFLCWSNSVKHFLRYQYFPLSIRLSLCSIWWMLVAIVVMLVAAAAKNKRKQKRKFCARANW